MPGFFRKVQGLFLKQPPNYSTFSDRIVASGLPSTKKHIRFIKNQGVTAIVSLTEHPLSQKLLDDENLTYIHIPLKDHQPADPLQLLEILEKVEDLLEKGHKVLVHCQAGYGRTGMVLAAYLMKARGLSWEESLKKLREIRPGSVELRQEKSLQELSSLLRKDL